MLYPKNNKQIGLAAGDACTVALLISSVLVLKVYDSGEVRVCKIGGCWLVLFGSSRWRLWVYQRHMIFTGTIPCRQFMEQLEFQVAGETTWFQLCYWWISTAERIAKSKMDFRISMRPAPYPPNPSVNTFSSIWFWFGLVIFGFCWSRKMRIFLLLCCFNSLALGWVKTDQWSQAPGSAAASSFHPWAKQGNAFWISCRHSCFLSFF